MSRLIKLTMSAFTSPSLYRTHFKAVIPKESTTTTTVGATAAATEATATEATATEATEEVREHSVGYKDKGGIRGCTFKPNHLEYLSNFSIHLMYSRVTHYFIAATIIWKWLAGTLYMTSITNAISYASIVAISATICRTIGRMCNNEYREFLEHWFDQSHHELRQYDYDFSMHGVDYCNTNNCLMEIMAELELALDDNALNVMKHADGVRELAIATADVATQRVMSPQTKSTWLHVLFTPIRPVVENMAASVLGRPLMYPGSTGLLNVLIGQSLLLGRSMLIEKYHGQRFKLKETGGHFVDCMFIDRRGSNSSKGHTLVIVCEGNASFYEVGVMQIALKSGYSILGYNHPGFGNSTGVPSPALEYSFMDSVLAFANRKLNWTMKDIMIYSWSIGSFAASQAGAHCPFIGSIVLDAPFDDVLPLARQKMPKLLTPLLESTIRRRLNLNNVPALLQYPGPVLIIRRLRDEMITTSRGKLSTNRANVLVRELLLYRYPAAIDIGTLDEILCQGQKCLDRAILDSAEILLYNEQCSGELPPYPNLGKGWTDEDRRVVTRFLCYKHMIDVDLSHCPELPYLPTAWSLQQISVTL